MSGASRLCGLIDEFLRPYTGPEEVVVSLSKEKEKEILIALSKVLKKIQLWTRSSSDNDKEVEAACKSECSGSSNSHSEDNRCLTKIVADFIVLLTLGSQYVRHLAGNVLSIISEFFMASKSDWNGFIHLLCVCLDVAFANTLSYPSAPLTAGGEDSNADSSNFLVAVKFRLKIADWSTVADIIRVLRNIFKYLKQDYDDHLLKVYLDALDSCLSNVRWDLVEEIHGSQNSGTQKTFSADAFFLRHNSGLEPWDTFLGNFLQLLCSLVDQSDFLEATDGSIYKHPIPRIILNLVPKVLLWCHGKQGYYGDSCISHYFSHKLLVLMIRLSFQTRQECSVLVSWLQLLQTYFQELLRQPMTQPESHQDDCLEGSPFLSSFPYGEMGSVHCHHIWRQAIFLFLKVSFSLISPKASTDKQCVCITPNSCSTYESNPDLECYCRKKGLLELSKWFQGHLPTETFLDHELYLKRCINFASSFLQSFMHEDDLLFEMLLQLLRVPFVPEQQLHKEREVFEDVKDDTLFHVSNLFNPIRLFHLFLLELHYDHQVLLDYLISKDTGISCAEYLLRCLRIVCDSWHTFVEFSLDGKCVNQATLKTIKVSGGGSNSGANVAPRLAKTDAIVTSLEKGYKQDHRDGTIRNITQAFEEAKVCLLSLRNSVRSLHKKNLFPYNPEVLLKRLTIFQELCFEEEKYFLQNF